MLTPIIFFAVAQMLTSWPDAGNIIAPQLVAQRVSACGLGVVSVRTDSEIHVDILVPEHTDHLSDQQLACAEKAADYYDVELAPSLQPRFDALRKARQATMMVEKGREWLRTHHLLDRLPAYSVDRTDNVAFAREIETLCGTEGALQSAYGPHAVNPQWAMQNMMPHNMNTGPVECLFNATAAAGFALDFIGYEQRVP